MSFIPSISLPSNALSFAFKRRFSPSDKLRLELPLSVNFGICLGIVCAYWLWMQCYFVFASDICGNIFMGKQTSKRILGMPESQRVLFHAMSIFIEVFSEPVFVFICSYWYNLDSDYWSAVYKHTYDKDFKFKAGYDSEVRLGWASLWVSSSICLTLLLSIS